MSSEIFERSMEAFKNASGWMLRQILLSYLHFEYDYSYETLHRLSVEAHGPDGHWQETHINLVKKTHPGIRQLGEYLVAVQKQKPNITIEQLNNLNTLWEEVDNTINKNNYPQMAIMYQDKLAILRLQIEFYSGKL